MSSAHPSVAAESREAPALVEYVDHEGRLYAVTAREVVARLRDLGPVDAVVSALRYSSFALARLARRGPDHRVCPRRGAGRHPAQRRAAGRAAADTPCATRSETATS